MEPLGCWRQSRLRDCFSFTTPPSRLQRATSPYTGEAYIRLPPLCKGGCRCSRQGDCSLLQPLRLALRRATSPYTGEAWGFEGSLVGRLKDERKTSIPGRLEDSKAPLCGTFQILSFRSNAFKKLRKICFKYFLQCNEITDKNISSSHFYQRICTAADRRSKYVHFCYRLLLGQPRCKPQPFYIFTKIIIVYFYFHMRFQKHYV